MSVSSGQTHSPLKHMPLRLQAEVAVQAAPLGRARPPQAPPE
jgi:hypothetical protein